MDNSNICAICLEECKNNEHVLLTLQCMHIFHYDCIRKLIKSTTILCPICRKLNIYVKKCAICKYRAKISYNGEDFCMIHYNNYLMFDIKSKNIDIQQIMKEQENMRNVNNN